MIKHYFKFIYVVLGIAGLIGCSNNGVQPVSLDSDDNSRIATVGTTGASFVSQCANFTLAVSKDETWPNGAHKIFILAGTTWMALESYSSIDAWKVAYDEHSGLIWVIARDKTLWKGLEQQVFVPGNNTKGYNGPIYAHDLSLAQTYDEYGTLCAYPFILLIHPNETGKKGYILWRYMPSQHKWSWFWDDDLGSGYAIAANPNHPDQTNSGDRWIVKNDGTLWLWNCVNEEWVQKASNCAGAESMADVTVSSNENIYYLKRKSAGFNKYIAQSINHGDSWLQNSIGRYLGAADKAWSVRYDGSIYRQMRGYTWQQY
jgi:hypothetical protein